MEGHPEPAKRQGEFWVPLAVPRRPCLLFLSLLPNPSPRPPESSSRHSGSPSTSSGPPPGLGPRGSPVAHAGAPPWPPASPASLSPSLQTRQSSGNTPGNTTALNDHVQGHHACRTSIHLSVQSSHSVMSTSAPPGPQQPGLPLHHQLAEFTQSHVHRVGDAIQPSHPLLATSPPALNLSQHQGLFQ